MKKIGVKQSKVIMKVFFEETTNQNEKKNFSLKKSLIVLKSTVKPQIFIEHDDKSLFDRVRRKFCVNFDKCGQKAEIMTYKYKFHSFVCISASN